MAKYKPIVAVCADACERLETQSGRIICTSTDSQLTGLQDGINFERLASCWNALLWSDTPKEDMASIKDALLLAGEFSKREINEHPTDNVAIAKNKIIQKALMKIIVEPTRG